MPLANVGQLRASLDAFPKIWLRVRCDKLRPGPQSKIEPCYGIAVDHHDQCGGAAGPGYALGPKDVALSRLKQGFDSPKGAPMISGAYAVFRPGILQQAKPAIWLDSIGGRDNCLLVTGKGSNA
jgi:hypothetical protein